MRINLISVFEIGSSTIVLPRSYDNAYAETFFKTLKSEEVDLQKYRDIFDVTDRVPEFLDDIYNERRVHSKLDYVSPNEFELQNEENKKTGKPRPIVKL